MVLGWFWDGYWVVVGGSRMLMLWLQDGYRMVMGWLRGGHGVVIGWLLGGFLGSLWDGFTGYNRVVKAYIIFGLYHL